MSREMLSQLMDAAFEKFRSEPRYATRASLEYLLLAYQSHVGGNCTARDYYVDLSSEAVA